MKRRAFLQLAARAAATAVVQHPSALISQPAAADVLTSTVGETPLGACDASHTEFGASRRSPDQLIEMLLEKTSGGTYQWTIDRRPHPAEALFLQQGRRYRLRMMNATDSVHTVRLRYHSFELARIHQVPVSGIFQDTLSLGRYNVVEADLLMSRSGPLLLR